MVSSGLWLMPELPPRRNSIACGITSCSFIASCPAPLGMRNTGRPWACTAASQRACQALDEGAAAACMVCSSVYDSPRRAAMRCSSARTSAASASRTGSVVARRSRLNRQRPGTTLIDPAGTCSCPTVPTASGTIGGAALDVQHQLGHRGGGVAAPVHRRRAGVAGHAGHLADVAHAAVDGSDHAQRQVQLVEHRALLDVNLHEAEVLRRVAPQRVDRIHRGRQAGGRHRVAQAHALGVDLVEPGGVEVAGERARAPGRWPCSAALPPRRSHTLPGHGAAACRCAKAPAPPPSAPGCPGAVVLAAVAHGVVVAAGQQPRRGGGRCRGTRPRRCPPRPGPPRRSRIPSSTTAGGGRRSGAPR